MPTKPEHRLNRHDSSTEESEHFRDQEQAWMLTTRSERRRPWPLLFAIAVHAGLLSLQLPKVSEIQAEPEAKPHIVLEQTPRFKPPEPKPIELRQPRARKEPIPGPLPDDPEPLVQDAEIERVLELPVTDDLFDFPPGPPPLPQDSGPRVISGDVEPPVVLQKIHPKYTEIARRARRQGIVVLKAVIDREGNVVDAKILKPLGFGLDDAALEASRRWRFTPATLHGKPVAVYMNLTVHFTLN